MALFQRRGSRQDTELQMAPMIDCVFLLLIFFMVSAIMRTRPHFQSPYQSQRQSTNFPVRNLTSLSVQMVKFPLMTS